VAYIGTVFPTPKPHAIKAHRQNGGAAPEQIFQPLLVDAPLGIKVRFHIIPFPAVTSNYLLQCTTRKRGFSILNKYYLFNAQKSCTKETVKTSLTQFKPMFGITLTPSLMRLHVLLGGKMSHWFRTAALDLSLITVAGFVFQLFYSQ